MSATQQFVMTVVSDGRYAAKAKEREFAAMAAGRVHSMDGVSSADCEVIDLDRVVISRAELEQLRNFKYMYEGLAK